MDLTADFKAFQDQVTSSLVSVTKTSTQLANHDLGFHRSSSDKFSRSIDRQNAHLLRLTNKLLKAAAQDTNIRAPILKDEDSIEDGWRGIVDVVDDLLEKADSALDEFTGVLKRQSTPSSPQPEEAPSSRTARNGRGGFAPWNREIPKPQLLFERKVNNFETGPFKPLLKSKPHAKVPLKESIGDGNPSYKHPYAREIEEYTYPDTVRQVAPPIPFTDPEASQPVFVDSEKGVLEMLDELRQAKEIAIDLEHNDLRSYVGIVCLMQISTRNKDWIIDTLKPWRENLRVLNDVFADPKILKVFHGSNMDMIWLQRDLGLYVVGLFDTYYACEALEFPGRGLKYLLQRFANFEAQKQHQLADWRIRPLPKELVDYARSDTHYLLNIYDHLRNMLVEASTPDNDLLDSVLRGSKTEALQVYERFHYDKDHGRGHLGWFAMLMQRVSNFSNEQFGVFRAVHEWRDKKARSEDEGIQHILSNLTLWKIAEAMPMYVGQFMQSVRPTPRSVLSYLPEVIEAIKAGRAAGKNGPSIQDVMKYNEEHFGLVPRRSRWLKPKEQEHQITGVGEILKELKSNGDIASPSAALTYDGAVDGPIATRSASSHFWGYVSPQQLPLPGATLAAVEALNSVLPLPDGSLDTVDHTEEVTNQSVEASPPTTSQTAGPSLAPNGASQQDTIFTLKEVGARKRKAEEIADNSDESAEPTPTKTTADEPDPADIEARRAQKALRKAARKAEKADKADSVVIPFDYDSAPNLLAVDGGAASSANGDTKKSERMNPFAKALDTSTGAKRGRMGKELAGKSMTFRS